MSNSLWPRGLWPTRLLCPWDSPGKNAGVGYHSLLQGFFLTQGSNLGLLHCRQILCHPSHQGSPGAWGLWCVSSLRWFWWLGSRCNGNKPETNMSPDVLVFPHVLFGDWCFVLRDWWMTDNHLEIKIYLACFDTTDSIRDQYFCCGV